MRGCGRAGGNPRLWVPERGRVFVMWGNQSTTHSGWCGTGEPVYSQERLGPQERFAPGTSGPCWGRGARSPSWSGGPGSTQLAGLPCPLLQGRGRAALSASRLPGVSAHLQGGKDLGSSATLVVAALGRCQGLGLRPRGLDGNAQVSASLERPPPRLESDHEVTLVPGLEEGSALVAAGEGVWAPSSAVTPSWTSWSQCPPVWLDVAGVQGQSAQHQQRGLSLLAGKRLALVKSG